MKSKIKKIRGIFVILPFWLKWARRFIKLDMKELEMPGLRGRSFDAVIVDEASEMTKEQLDYFTKEIKHE